MLTYTREDIGALAGDKSYDRGVDYVDAVTELAASDDDVTATVEGTAPYQVRLDVAGGLAGDCDCPWGQEGNFCKHCVAVALVYLYHAEHGTLIAEPESEPPGLDDYLSSLSQEELVELLREVVSHDPALRQRLELRAAAAAATPEDLGHVRRGIDNLLHVEDYVGYRQARDYASQVDDVTQLLAELFEAGHGAAVVTLAQHSLRTVGEMFNNIDDSSGHVGASAAELAALHSEVCADVRPDPPALADWLLSFQTSGYAWPELDVAEYEDALGEQGMDRYGEALAATWRECPADDRDYRYYQLSHLMQDWEATSRRRGV